MMIPEKTCALLVGLDYPQYVQYRQLSCCANDVRLVGALLTDQYHVPNENITIITDEHSGAAATWYELVIAIYRLALESWKKDLDVAVFMFSGHGTQVFADKSEGEADGLDEGIAPTDFDIRGVIKDGYLKQLFENFNPKTKVVCLFDCCHSGSMMDLPFYYLDGSDASSLFVKKSECDMKSNIIMLSACKDKQISADYYDDRTQLTYGALTKILVDILKERPQIQIDQLQSKINEQYQRLGYNQVCIASASKQLPEEGVQFF